MLRNIIGIYCGSVDAPMRMVLVESVFKNAITSSISDSDSSNSWSRGEGVGISESLGVPTYLFWIGAGFPKL